MHTFTFTTLSFSYWRDYVYWSGAWWRDGYPQQRKYYDMRRSAGQRHLYRQWKHAHRLEDKPWNTILLKV